MNRVKCIKTVNAKKGFQFKQGESYDYAIHSDGIVIYLTTMEYVKVKSMDVFNKFFK